MRRSLGILAATSLFFTSVLFAESPTPASPTAREIPAAGRLRVEKVHFPALAGNVTGEDPNRTVAVYLPPSYDRSPERRYPVLFLLHGIGGTEGDWTQAWEGEDPAWGTVQGLMDHGIAEGRLREMIVVMPDESTKAGGSFYVDSAVTGNWEQFTVRDLVEWVDGELRTLARPESRGIAGHSMGGYGAILLGMKHPDVFAVVYGMSSSTLDWAADFSADNPDFRAVLEVTRRSDLGSRYQAAIVCAAQAFSPNPDRPPFYVDFPFRVEDGRLVPNGEVFAAWNAKFPVLLAARYADDLRRLRGLRFDAGSADDLAHIPIASRELSRVLGELGVPHVFEEYNGDHRNRLWGREGRLYNEVLPWFSLLLESAATRSAEPLSRRAAPALAPPRRRR